MDPKKQIAYGVLKLIVEALVGMLLERANKVPVALHGMIKNGNGHGTSHICPYGDNHKFSHETDMILHITIDHPASEIARGLKQKVIIS